MITALAVTAVAVAGASAMAATATPSDAAAACSSGYVALTFDDGPNGNTNTLLNTLKSAGVRATLFNIGQNAQNNSALVTAEKNAGMWIGNHSWSHQHMTSLGAAQMSSDLSQTQQAIQKITGTAPQIFRPPYGETNATLQSAASSLGLRTVTWDVDSKDWNGASTAAIVSAAGSLQNGGIILMHDQYATTIAAIPQIVSNLTSRGLCAGMISPSTGRAVAPDGTSPSTPPPSSPSGSTPPPAGGCMVTTTISSWNTGLTAAVTIANTSTAAINGWKLTFTLPSGQSITSGWNATYSPTSGQVTATNAAYNATINPNGSVSIGYQATHSGTAAAPTGFALNGTSCSAA